MTADEARDLPDQLGHTTTGTRINFPVFEQLDVSGYGLFPGGEVPEPGLHITFRPGLTLVLGANGLGKTTLVTILLRLLTGPFDISLLPSRWTLGNIDLRPSPLYGNARAVFANRVADGAGGAVARLAFRLGTRRLLVERRLSNLALIHLSVDEQDLGLDDQGVFQVEIPRLVGVSSFSDWILLLHEVVFYMEERRALVWDPSAQRQVLRTLLLPVDTSRQWTESERAILTLDSQTRNLTNILNRQERVAAVTEVKLAEGKEVRDELASLEELQRVDIESREKLDAVMVDVDLRREEARLRVLKAEQERESRYRDLERAKLLAIEARFPDTSATARYIMAQLLTDNTCLVCGHFVPEVSSGIEDRITKHLCVVCGSNVSDQDHVIVSASVSDLRVENAAKELAAIEPEVEDARNQLQAATQEYGALASQLRSLDLAIGGRVPRIEGLIQRLPPADANLFAQRSALAAMRADLEAQELDLAERRRAFAQFMERTNREMVTRSGEIEGAFGRYAEGFLLEDCNLTWSLQRVRVGQTGEPIPFPTFELDMTGAGFRSPVRRNGPDQVSESQREFIDLAFRMALIEVAGSDGVGSLVIDAPESSLDAVFVERAANVLSRFAEPTKGNRLTVTSNLVEGDLIPTLLNRSSSNGDRVERVVNLFQIAEPTAAVRQYRHEYDKILSNILAEDDDSS